MARFIPWTTGEGGSLGDRMLLKFIADSLSPSPSPNEPTRTVTELKETMTQSKLKLHFRLTALDDSSCV